MADTEDSTPTMATTTVGQRLRAAREERGLSLEDVANQTRIPLRHLDAIEKSDWERLPAPTYTVGFAKSYASAVGVDRNEVADSVRDEIGGTRPQTHPTMEMFEPADPARTMPKWLVFAALGAIILVVVAMTWLNERSLEPEATPVADTATSAPSTATAAQPTAPPPAATGPVVLNAVEPVWLQVYERDGRTLFQGELAAGQRYEVPASATEPLLRTGKPQALRIMVGSQVAPAVGEPARTVSDVSLRAPDLMGRAAPAAPGTPAPTAAPGAPAGQ